MEDIRCSGRHILIENLLEQCADEWKNMWHNATITDWPEIESDKEWTWFWSWLGDQSHFWIDDLQELIKEDFGLDMVLYFWGRSSATVAPDGFLSKYYRELGEDTILDLEYYSDLQCPDEYLDAYNIAKNHLEAFRLINKTVKAGASVIAKQWEEAKEANKWEFDCV